MLCEVQSPFTSSFQSSTACLIGGNAISCTPPAKAGAIQLPRAIKFTLEQALDFIDDGLVEKKLKESGKDL